jgi:hypothetical protein
VSLRPIKISNGLTRDFLFPVPFLSFDPFCTFRSFRPSSCHLCSIILSLYNKHNTNIHVSGGIQTHKTSKRTAVNPRLRPRGHWVSADWNLGTSVVLSTA